MCAGHNTRSGVKLSNGPVRRTPNSRIDPISALAPPTDGRPTIGQLKHYTTISPTTAQPLSNPAPTIGNLNPSTTCRRRQCNSPRYNKPETPHLLAPSLIAICDWESNGKQHDETGILLAGCSLVSRAGASKSPTSPTYQQQTAKMKKKENILRFLLLLFLARRMFALEIRHGDVVAFQLVGVPVNLFNLASGHRRRRGASMFFRRRVHYGLICGPRDFRRSEGRAMMFCQYRFAPGI